jgi:thiol-disulfide isomerase/thioredoxin
MIFRRTARGAETILFIVGLAVWFAVVPAGCGGPTPGPGIPSNIAQVVSVTDRAGRAPDFTWKGPDGSDVSFDGVRGKITLVNFWATWCAPCKKELPDLVELSRRYADRGFRVVGVSTDRTPNAMGLVAEFVRKYSIPYQVVLSTQEMEDAFKNVRMLPTSFLVDGDGRIVRTMVGIRTRAQLEEAIAPLL